LSIRKTPLIGILIDKEPFRYYWKC